MTVRICVAARIVHSVLAVETWASTLFAVLVDVHQQQLPLSFIAYRPRSQAKALIIAIIPRHGDYSLERNRVN